MSCVSFLRLTASPTHMGLAGEEPLLAWDSPFAVARRERRSGGLAEAKAAFRAAGERPLSERDMLNHENMGMSE